MKAKTEETLAVGQKGSDRRRAGTLFVFGSLLFLLLTTAAEAMYPNFSLQTNAISDLAAIGTPTTVVEEAAILGFAVSWAVGAYYLFRRTGKNRMMVVNLIPGASFLLAGLFPENINIVFHSIGAAVGFPIAGVAAIASYKQIGPPFRYFAVSLGVLSLVATFVIFVGYRIGPCGTCGYTQGLSALLLGLGGWESMIIYPLLIWLMGFGSYLLAFGKL
jgi:hypothetical membrane protein